MSEERLTPQEWADMNATALAEKNREILIDLISRLEAHQAKAAKEGEANHWRRVFAAAAIEGGKTCEEAIALADEMVQRLCSA